MLQLLMRRCLLVLVSGFVLPVWAQLDTAAQLELGRQIYLHGQLTDGKPLVGRRNGDALHGAEAACVSCHRRSGLGGVEGVETIPPITGRALFGGGEPVVVRQDKRFIAKISEPHTPYDAQTFAEAVTSGRHISGRALSPLMARYALNDMQLQAVAAYLRTLSVAMAPGVGEQEIRLATVLVPGISPERKKAFIDTIQTMVNQHNVNVVSGLRQKISAVERRLQIRRKWTLDVWALTGPRETWGQQLDAWQQQNPVFSIISGLALDHWEPVHDFCEKSHVVCWFPSVDVVPQGAEHGAYNLYFSKGVELEAEVLLKRWLAGAEKPSRVIQLVGSDPQAQRAAQITYQRLTQAGLLVQELAWSEAGSAVQAATLSGMKESEALLLWLRGDELEKLTNSVPAPLSTLFASATFDNTSGAAWSDTWRKNAWLIQRLEMPQMREANLARFQDWRKFRGLALVDEKMQSEVYFAVNSFSWMLTSMLNNLHTDYLIERAESTLSLREAMQVQAEVQAMMMGGGGRRPPVDFDTMGAAPEKKTVLKTPDMSLMMKREGTTAYPHLSLGVGQRFASKGAYLQKINASSNTVNHVEPTWVVP